MNDLPKLPEQVNESVLRWLHSRMRSMRRRAGDISQAKQGAAGGDAVGPDPAQGCVDERIDIGGCESAGVKV